METPVLVLKRKEERARRISAGLCAVCGKAPLDGPYACAECKEKNKIAAREARAQRRAAFIAEHGADGRTLRAVERRAATEKQCRVCQKVKGVEDFSWHDTHAGVRRTICKVCDTARADRWSKDNPSKRAIVYRRRHLKRTFGLREEDYEEMLKAQSGGCAICARSNSGARNHRLFVDHDHRTGQIRGLLCFKCNAAIGGLDDSVSRAEKLIVYLKQFSAP